MYNDFKNINTYYNPKTNIGRFFKNLKNDHSVTIEQEKFFLFVYSWMGHYNLESNYNTDKELLDQIKRLIKGNNLKEEIERFFLTVDFYEIEFSICEGYFEQSEEPFEWDDNFINDFTNWFISCTRETVNQ